MLQHVSTYSADMSNLFEDIYHTFYMREIMYFYAQSIVLMAPYQHQAKVLNI